MAGPGLYNSRIINTYLKYLKKNFPHADIGELLSYARMKSYEVADQSHWFTQEQINRFHEKMTRLTGDENIAREAGRYAASPESIGVMRQYIFGFMNPATVYEIIEKAARGFTRSCVYEYKKIDSKKIEIIVTPHEGVSEKKFQCENRMGYFESIGLAFDNKIPRIEHPECIFSGGNKCRYIISWESNLLSVLKQLRNSAAVLGLAAGIVLSIFLPVTTVIYYFFAALLAVFFLTFLCDYLTKKNLRKSLLNRESTHEELVRQMDKNYNNSLMINEIGQAVSRQTNIESILKIVIQIFRNRLDYDRCMLLMRNEKKDALIFQTGFGYTPAQLKTLKNTEFRLRKQKTRDIYSVSYNEKKPYLVNDISLVDENLSAQSMQFIRELGARSFICCPIVCDREPMGVLSVDNVKTKRPLIQSDLQLLMGISSVIGISIKNAELYDARAKQLQSILNVLAASIDARDPYTAGHSEKVTEYAIGICREMGVPRDYTEIVGIAAALHDYGKIGISDSLLKKKGSLTESEREIIKTHAEKTRQILERINFMGEYNKIPEIAGSHHEKLDGSGYPLGLKGSEIPLGSQIIAVADFFEAITSRRHYRDSLPLNEAFQLLKGESGRHFDRNIIKAFINYYKKTKIRVAYTSLLAELEKEKDISRRSVILDKIDSLKIGPY
ncbi:MAG TPA: HD domain-containing phosphohydrolase [Spirochaetota bacterium]|nr:HD domain-containing phosphohydrolase [Spirochaetota bacterium]HPV39979.1 HD domain-containing phosphohydrolase [Spirochaetota bacterium]